MIIEVDVYHQHFGIQHATVSRIVHESAMVAAVYKVEQRYDDSFILKIYDLPHHYYRERMALERFPDVIPVYASRAGDSKCVDGYARQACSASQKVPFLPLITQAVLCLWNI